MIRKVTSLGELRRLSRNDVRYNHLLRCGASNLGGPPYKPTDPIELDADAAYEFLKMTAMETSEEGVMDEVNFCRDIVS